jgi:hypothetical protein
MPCRRSKSKSLASKTGKPGSLYDSRKIALFRSENITCSSCLTGSDCRTYNMPTAESFLAGMMFGAAALSESGPEAASETAKPPTVQNSLSEFLSSSSKSGIQLSLQRPR